MISARAVGLDVPADHKLATAFAALDGLSGSRALPAGTDNPFGRSWQPLIDQPDRSAAGKSYTAATAMLLKRALNNRSVTAKDSLHHKSTEARLIPPAMWRRDRGRYWRDLSIPPNPEHYLRRVEETLDAGMARLAAAVEGGLVSIDDDGVHLPRRKRAPEDPAVARAHKSKLSSGHIWIRGDIRAGRSEAVRSALILAITEDVSAIAAVPAASIWVYLALPRL